jgi:hypothetical protein
MEQKSQKDEEKSKIGKNGKLKASGRRLDISVENKELKHGIHRQLLLVTRKGPNEDV